MAHTVCIAAACEFAPGRHSVIMCSDARIEIEGVASGDVPYKARFLGDGFSAMFAGTISKARELGDRYSIYFKRKDVKINDENVRDIIRKPLEVQNRLDLIEYLSAREGINHGEFLRLPEHERATIMQSFAAHRSRCELILVWIAGKAPRIFVVGEGITEESPYAAIGIGANAAITSLLSRGYRSIISLEEAMYCVYEAKRNSETVPGVGKDKTYLVVLEFDPVERLTVYHPFQTLSLNALAKQYARFGPRPFSGGDCLPGEKLDLRSLRRSSPKE